MKKRINLLLPALFSLYHLFAQTPIDKQATPETKALYKNLWTLSRKQILFGHQHATEYGHGWTGEAGRSDVKSVTGSHPAVIGVDFSGLSGKSPEQMEKTFRDLQSNITETYNRGGITTVSWHFNNPVTPTTGFYWKKGESAAALPLLLPGASHHQQYKQILQTLAQLAKSVKGNDGTLAPMIFRPYHEFDGDWFWWGHSHCTTEEFKKLWRFTVSYLKDSLQVHNFIYAFSPDCKFNSEATFLERYPGDDFVDMVGMDDYADFGRDGKYDLDSAVHRLKVVSDYALKSHKLAALTETGLESIPNPEWWTGFLQKVLQKEKMYLTYVLVWRNDSKSPTHYYAPFPGHISEPDFIRFYNDPYTVFENDLKVIFKRGIYK